MACRLCVKLIPLSMVSALDEELKRGDSTIEVLAERYSVEEKYLIKHWNKCLGNPARNGYELLQRILDDVTTTANEMRQSYDPGDPDLKYSMNHYIKLVRELRETVAIMDKLRPSDELINSILEEIMQPLVAQFARICVEEIERHRNELLALLGADHRAKIDESAQGAIRRMAERYKAQMESLIPRLEELIKNDSDNQKKDKRPADPSKASLPASSAIN